MKTQHERLDKQVELDLQFQENLMFYRKDALAHLLSTIATGESTRRWMLQTLEIMQDMGYTLNLYSLPVMHMKVMEALREKIDRITDASEPTGLNSGTIAELAGRIAETAIKADNSAGNGNNLQAMNLLLEAAALAVAGISYQAEHNPIDTQRTGREPILRAESEPQPKTQE